jgi:hypothetical protein
MLRNFLGLDRKQRSPLGRRPAPSRVSRPRRPLLRLEELEQRDVPTGVISPFRTLDLTLVPPNRQITITATPPFVGPAHELVQVEGESLPRGDYGSDVFSLNILLGNGGVNVVVQSTNIPTQLTGFTLGSTPNVTVMTNGLTGGLFANIWGPVHVVNPPNYTHLEVRSTASQGQTATLSLDSSTGIGTISGLTPRAITYQQDDLSALLIQGGNGGNTFHILDTGKGSHPMTTTLSTGSGNNTVDVEGTTGALVINTGSGQNTVNVEGTTGPLVINRQGGHDTINVSQAAHNLDNIKGDVSVYGNSAFSTLNVDDRVNSASNVYTMTPGLVSVARPNVGRVIYGTLDNLVVDGGRGDNVYNILNTQFGTNTTLYTGDGTDVVNVLNTWGPLTIYAGGAGGGNDVVNVEQTTGFVFVNLGGGNDTVNISPAAQNLDGISGDVFVTGGLGFATLNVDDQANTLGSPYTMTSTREDSLIQRPHPTGMGGSTRIHYRLIPAVFVNGGSGANTYNVLDTEGSATTTLNTGNGNDTVNVSQTTGSLAIHGGSGNDTVNVEQTTGALTITLGSGSNTVNISPVGQDLGQIAGPAFIDGSAGSATINLHDDGFSDTYMVTDGQTTVNRLGAGFNFTYLGISLIHLYTQSTSAVTDGTVVTTLWW